MSKTIKERPILFSGAMVRALLNGSKTQTRRKEGLEFVNENPGCWQRQWVPAKDGKHWLFTCGDDEVRLRCPKGVEGDRLWVRETWAAHWMYNDVPPIEAKSSHPNDNYWFAADPDGTPGTYNCPSKGFRGRWRPSIHMPRFVSRLLLEITAVRCERLQAISEADAVAEGVESCIADLAGFGARARGMKLYRDYERKENSLTDARGTGFSEAVASYESLWASINGPESWAANPWVWVVEFKVIEGGKEAPRA